MSWRCSPLGVPAIAPLVGDFWPWLVCTGYTQSQSMESKHRIANIALSTVVRLTYDQSWPAYTISILACPVWHAITILSIVIFPIDVDKLKTVPFNLSISLLAESSISQRAVYIPKLVWQFLRWSCCFNNKSCLLIYCDSPLDIFISADGCVAILGYRRCGAFS